MPKSLQLPSGYQELLQELKGRIRTAQVRAAFAVNRELVLLYWSIGRDLSLRFDREDWGGKIVDRLSKDLQAEFPGVEGFSPRSLRYMRAFAEAWPDEPIFAAGCCKIAVGSSHGPPRPPKGGRGPRMVPSRRPGERLEPERSGSHDLGSTSREEGKRPLTQTSNEPCRP